MPIDPSVFIAPGAIVLGDVAIGARSSVWFHCVIRGDAEAITIGDSTNIQDLSVLHADPGIPCQVGHRVTVGHRVILHGCTIEDDCLIGMGAIVLNGAHIGSGSVVGAGTLVPEGMKVPPGSVVIGSPGRIVREVSDRLRDRIAHGWQHYVEAARQHAEGAYPLHQPGQTPK
jgi:carbonic anhydrase/acetyltransferase-like protein (isoleucine patch superfamily)